jgi:hypothetical protein
MQAFKKQYRKGTWNCTSSVMHKLTGLPSCWTPLATNQLTLH